MRLDEWQETDEYFDLLAAGNTPEMTRFLGGPEPEAKLRERHVRYAGLAGAGAGRMFGIRAGVGDTAAIVDSVDDVLPLAGSVGYWEREWLGGTVWEAGWAVLPAFQGRGLAVAAVMEMQERAAAERRHRMLHAYPKVDHPASNGVCLKTGFTRLGPADFEYPPGHRIRCNDWCFALWDD
ncbi:GNAT family N-acetyltransferase [Yinghuangia sp. YIM S09857]|uniref:GNAT family N-acetyltransferase n=1 Tax=Yinghuangia sp. YIM S09857 TaxID=3436929 RepID=UPI003F538891